MYLDSLTLLEVLHILGGEGDADTVHPGLLLAEALTLDVSRHGTLAGNGEKTGRTRGRRQKTSAVTCVMNRRRAWREGENRRRIRSEDRLFVSFANVDWMRMSFSTDGNMASTSERVKHTLMEPFMRNVQTGNNRSCCVAHPWSAGSVMCRHQPCSRWLVQVPHLIMPWTSVVGGCYFGQKNTTTTTAKYHSRIQLLTDVGGHGQQKAKRAGTVGARRVRRSNTSIDATPAMQQIAGRWR